MSVRHDLFSGHAAEYAAFRPTYPDELFEFLADLTPARRWACDVACGNGQASAPLARRFDRVAATDASRQQLAEAPRIANVGYAVAAAERLPLANGFADLIAVAQALHWFDLPKFFAEARRVLRPGGVLACWAYDLFQITPDVDRVVARLYDEILAGYWTPERRLIETGYRTIDFPFAEISPPEFTIRAAWTLPQTWAYLNTWSSVKKYQRMHGANPLKLIERELATAWSDGVEPKPLRWQLHLRVGRA